MQLLSEKFADKSLERAILGAFIFAPEESEKYLHLIEPEDFADLKHRKLFNWLKTLLSSGEVAETSIILAHFREDPISKEIPVEYILSIEDRDIFPVKLMPTSIKLLKEKAAKRKILEVSQQIPSELERENEISTILSTLEQTIYDIEKRSFEDKTEPISSVIFRLYETVEKRKEIDTFITGVPSGFSELDRRTAGFQPGELIIIGARPGMGKTALATSVSLNAAQEGYRIGFISLEMPKEQIAMRMLSNYADIPLYNIRTGLLDNEQLEKLQDYSLKLAQMPILINDKSGMKITELRAYAKKLKREHDIDILFVDYLQLVQADKFLESKEREVSEVSRTLKALAMELDIPVVALAQLNRVVEMRSDKRPMLSDLRNSGQIEQDADLIMFIHRPEYYKKNPIPEELGLAELIIAKQRNGELGTVNLEFHPKYARFTPKVSQTEMDISDYGQTTETEDVPF
ncbi:replicative DNA helicase [Persephonella sp.]|uniref:replicative DNA helicase n=1 Tax=Persephonella sp. TaxID=2060922 RepID=UPI0026197797|nr:replicative DNA helicase [Persephonella sp.]